ncbi:hypothetical protein AQUCO_01700676v1 [Aquilegia coerulea]|uniref:Ethylene receptor n=1 Tax=Aquilegia coerulea TaxID=218851 RepID=A0A2G5DPX4_AQUCA|nr:hypothetical protein AQUCO_01700676v1 [Aquilegia coerulea]
MSKAIGFWSIESIMHCQQVSDFLIAIAYFSIPLELLYFISCSNIPFKWVLAQFIAFIVLCGMTHLLNGWTYAPHTFQLMLALTIFKILTALVSCATAITLITLIPLLLKLKVRELFLKKKAWELDREVGMMKKQKEASWHVRMLTHEIRKSLDRHTILYTTLIELSNTLDLQNCAVWMPNEDRTEMNLTHELKGRSRVSIPYDNPDVLKIKNEVLKIARDGGTPELIQACYAILVLVLPNANGRDWTYQELEIVKVVADQVAVALSHAAVLEESQLMRDKLAEQNRALQQAKKDAMMASQARNSFQMVMSKGMRRPMHSISGLLSMIQQDNVANEQKMIVDTMVKTSSVLSTLINDVMEISSKDTGRLPLEMGPFHLHPMIKEAACLAKCLCVSKGFGFSVDVGSSLPNLVIGDERRVFQVILHMVGNLLIGCDRAGFVTFRTSSVGGIEGRNDQRRAIWRPSSSEGYTFIKFEIGFDSGSSQLESSYPPIQLSTRINSEGIDGGLSFNMCKKLVQMMQGNIWVAPSSRGLVQSMTLVLKFELSLSGGDDLIEPGPPSNSQLRGLRVILADDDGVNRLVTRKLLEKLGCHVTAVSSGFECLSALGTAGSSFQIILLDLHMPEMDGFEVAMRVRKFQSRSCPLIVALTASADEDVWQRCLQVGMNGLIRKPVLLEGIAAELHSVLQANIGM